MARATFGEISIASSGNQIIPCGRVGAAGISLQLRTTFAGGNIVLYAQNAAQTLSDQILYCDLALAAWPQILTLPTPYPYLKILSNTVGLITGYYQLHDTPPPATGKIVVTATATTITIGASSAMSNPGMLAHVARISFVITGNKAYHVNMSQRGGAVAMPETLLLTEAGATGGLHYLTDIPIGNYYSLVVYNDDGAANCVASMIVNARLT